MHAWNRGCPPLRLRRRSGTPWARPQVSYPPSHSVIRSLRLWPSDWPDSTEGTTSAVAAGRGEGELSSADQEASAALCQRHQLLGNPIPVSEIVAYLLEGTDDEALLGLQLCFGIFDTRDQ